MLSPVQAGGADPVVKGATFAAGTFTVPARTTAVFVEPTPAASVSVELSVRGVVNPTSRGSLAFTVLSQAGLDPVADVVVDSLRFGVTGQEDSVVRCEGVRDENGDGLRDLRCTSKVPLTGVDHGTSELLLTGSTSAGAALEGSATIRTVPAPKRPRG